MAFRAVHAEGARVLAPAGSRMQADVGSGVEVPGQALPTAQPRQAPVAVALDGSATWLGSALSGTVLTAGLAPRLLPYCTPALVLPLCHDAANGQRRLRPRGALQRLEPATATPSVTLAGGPQSVRKDPSRQVRQTKM
ncbi:hypothetical protein QFZ68_006584 [Streptomyces sp. V1I6]|nr:hypothetical protein [Streptomyces sp. V1I6]